MKIIRLIFRFSLLLYFGLFAYNVLINPFPHADAFKTNFKEFVASLRARCNCGWLNDFKTEKVTDHSLLIVKVSHFLILVLSVLYAFTRRGGWAVALVFLKLESIKQNWASIGLNTTMSQVEDIARVLTLALILIRTSKCSFKIGRCGKVRHEGRHSRRDSEEREAQAEIKRTDESPEEPHKRSTKRGH